MKKPRSVKGVKYAALVDTLYMLMMWMYDLRIKYDFTEAALWDVLFIQRYILSHGKGPTITTLMLKRYRKNTGYKALRQRLDLLIKRGLIIQVNRQLFPAELLGLDLAAVGKSLDLIESLSDAA